MEDITLEQLTARDDFASRVAAEEERLAAFWAAGADGLNTAPGTPTRDLVVTPSAEAGVLNLERVDRMRRSSSLYELLRDPALADPESVDRILANHPTLKRRVDSPARGYLAFYMPSDSITVVPKASVFSVNGLTYRSEMAYLCTPGALTGEDNRPLTPMADGTWVFTVPVTAEGTGAEYNIKAGTELQWQSSSVRVVKIVADTDFHGGVDPESNLELLQRLDSGLAAPGDAGRMNIHALLLREFPFIADISLIGGGDREMQRDGRNLLGLKVGGKTDAYVRTSLDVTVRKFEITAEVVDEARGVLQLHIGRDVYPGFYDLMAIRRRDDTELDPALTITEQRYGCDLENLLYDAPEVREEVDYRFSRFQTLDVRFEDRQYDPDDLVYSVALLGVPAIADIQDYMSRRDVRSPNNDTLVRASVPTLTSINVTVEHLEAGPAVDAEACRVAVIDAANRVRFEHGKLSTSGIVQAVQNALPSTAQVQPPVDILGVTIHPGGQVLTKRTTLELIPDLVEGGPASSRNISFFVSGVSITLKPVVRLQV